MYTVKNINNSLEKSVVVPDTIQNIISDYSFTVPLKHNTP